MVRSITVIGIPVPTSVSLMPMAILRFTNGYTLISIIDGLMGLRKLKANLQNPLHTSSAKDSLSGSTTLPESAYLSAVKASGFIGMAKR